MKYHIVVKNSQGDNLAIFESFEDAVNYCECKKRGLLISTYCIQLIPKADL